MTTMAADAPGLFDGVTPQDMSPSERLKSQCVGVRLNFNWFSKSKQVDAESKNAMANGAATNIDAFSANKRLMSSKHPTIKEANELRRRIEAVWKSKSLPMAAYAVGSGRGVEPGVRMVNINDYQTMRNDLMVLQPEVDVMCQKLNSALPDIKALDRKTLGGTYNEEDYPETLSIGFSFGIVPIEIPKMLEQLSPEVYNEEVTKTRQWLSSTASVAIESFLSEFLTILKSWVDALSPVMRIKPPAGSPHVQYSGAEVRAFVTPEQDNTIPVGKGRVQIRYKLPGDATYREHELGPMTRQEFLLLRPTQCLDEKRTFHKSTIEGLSGFMTMFRNVDSMLTACDSQTRNKLSGIMQQVEEHLAKCSDTDDTVNELRTSGTFRASTHALMANLSRQVESQLVVTRQQAPRRTITI